MNKDPNVETLAEEALATAERVDFPCENCGASMTWDPAVDALSCEYCGSHVQVPREEGLILERALADTGSAARGLGLEVRVAKCATCGARVAFDDTSTSEVCVYCGSANVLAEEAKRNAIRPESLLPLDIDRAQVQQNFERWIKGLWFRPNAIKNTKNYRAQGIYVPFWTFDCRVHSKWSADAGHYYYVMQPTVVMIKGKPTVRMRRVRKVRWVPAWGDRHDAYDDMLVNASCGLPEPLLAKLGAFDTGELVPYKPQYLAGWHAEEYEVDLEQGWEQAERVVVNKQRVRCAGDVPGDTYRSLRVQNAIYEVLWKHVLLPVWSLQYRYSDKTYTVLIHGQTGKVVGKAPISWSKIMLVVAAVLFAGLFVVSILALAG